MFRFKTRAQFQAVLSERVIAKSAHFALHRHSLEADGGAACASAAAAADPAPTSSLAAGRRPRPLFSPAGLWLGAMVPKRWARRSVTRHAIKRQIQAVAQATLPQDDRAAYLVRLRADFSRQQFHSSSSEVLKQAVHAELVGLMSRLPRPAPAP